MARVSNWSPQKYDGEFALVCMERLKAAAEVVAAKARSNLQVIVQHSVSRPPYKTGPLAGDPKSAREPGALLKTIRVVEKKETNSGGIGVLVGRNIRIYAGNKVVWYAGPFEYATTPKRGRPFLRPALNTSKGVIKEILEHG